jgi:hypothetical protein
VVANSESEEHLSLHALSSRDLRALVQSPPVACLLSPVPPQFVGTINQTYGVDLHLSMTVTHRICRKAGLAHVATGSTTLAGKNEHDRADIVAERAAAMKKLFSLQHRVIKPTTDNVPAVSNLVRGRLLGLPFSDAQQVLMNVQLRWYQLTIGGAWIQERPLLYLSHDEKVFWAHEGATREWQHTDPTVEPEVQGKLRGKGFGSSIMVAAFVSVLGIFYWEVTRYGSKNGYWNGARMRRHMKDALDYAEREFPAVRTSAQAVQAGCDASASPS